MSSQPGAVQTVILSLPACLDARQQMRLRWEPLRATTGGFRAAMSTHGQPGAEVRRAVANDFARLRFASDLTADRYRPIAVLRKLRLDARKRTLVLSSGRRDVLQAGSSARPLDDCLPEVG